MANFKGQKIPICYASCSIGHKPEHNLPAKLQAISDAGFDAIELSMPDILSFAQEQTGKEPDPKDYATLRDVGKKIKQLTDQHNLKILILQPFANFEGWPKNSDKRKDAFERAKGWMSIMEAVGTDMLQVILESILVAQSDKRRSARQMQKESLEILTTLPVIWPSWQTFLAKKVSVSHTKIGVGRLMRPRGRMCGKSSRRPIDPTSDCAWTRFKVVAVNGVAQ